MILYKCILIYWLLAGIFCTYKIVAGRNKGVSILKHFILGFYILPVMLSIFGVRAITDRWNKSMW